MTKIKTIIASIMCGFSTFTIMPSNDYYRHIAPDAASITNDAWQNTGRNLRNAINKMGAENNAEVQGSC